MANSYLNLLRHMDKLQIYSDSDTLDMFCEYLMNDKSKKINYANLLNLQEYINSMDPKVFGNSDSKLAKYQYIKYYLEGKLTKGLSSRKLANRYAMSAIEPRLTKTAEREIFQNLSADNLKGHDIEFINSMIYAKLNVKFLHQYKIALSKMIEDIDADTITSDDDVDSCIELIQTLLSELTQAKRRSKRENRFNLTDKMLLNSVLSEACDRLLSDSNYLSTGFQGLDMLLNGGFQNARIYNFIGATGGFKSGLLLNLMKTIQRNNRGRPHKDPDKRPTILFISQENNMWETIERIFSIYGKPDDIRNHTKEEIFDILEKGGFHFIDDNLSIDIEFRYYGNEDIGVPDLKGIYDELENQGREVICIIQDYIERLKPPTLQVDRRIQLFNIANQLHDLAQELDIPIITGSQFNRNGVATIEQMQVSGKADIGKNVGSNDVSESFAMLKNFDVNIGIVIEFDSNEDRFYLSFRRFKLRGKDGSLDYFLQPFVGTRSKIQLMEDAPLPSAMYRTSLHDADKAIMKEESLNLDRGARVTHKLTTGEILLSDTYSEMLADAASDDAANACYAEMLIDTEASERYWYKLPTEDDNKHRGPNGFIKLIHKVTCPGLTKDGYRSIRNMTYNKDGTPKCVLQ